MKKKLTDKQQRFVEEYLIDFNATQAAIRAGYSVKTATEMGYENLTKPQIAEAVDKGKAEAAERAKLSVDDVVNQYKRFAFSDLRKFFNKDGTLKSIHELDDDTAQALAGMDIAELISGKDGPIINTKKIKVVDKLKALDSIARHFGMFKDKVEVDLAGGLADRLAKALEKSNG